MASPEPAADTRPALDTRRQWDMRRARGAGAVLAAVAVLAACSDDGKPAPKGTKPSASASTSAAQPRSGTRPDSEFGREYTVVPDRDADHLEPGPWALKNMDGPGPLAVVDVPGGFGYGSGIFWGEEGFVGYWMVASVFEDPCAGNDLPVKVGATVADLATALSEQKLTATTQPVPVSIGGYDGLYMELTMPKDLDFKSCDQDHFFIWQTTATPNSFRVSDESVVDRYWILDIDGRRLVFNTALPHGADKETVELHSRMVEGIEFVPRRRR